MRVLINGKPFKFQPPSNASSVRRLCQELRVAGFELRPQILRAQTGAVPRDIESRTMALLNDRTTEGRLALLQWIVQAPVTLEQSDGTPVPRLSSTAINGHSLPPPYCVLVHRGSTSLYVRLPSRDRSMGLYDLVGLCRAEGLKLHPDLSALLGNSRHNWVQALDARFRRCTRPVVLAEILGQVLDPSYKIEVPEDPIVAKDIVPRGGINLLIDGRSVVLPAIRSMAQVGAVCGILSQAGLRIKPSHGNPPFAASDGERRRVMKMLPTAATPEGARRLVEWLVDAAEVRVA